MTQKNSNRTRPVTARRWIAAGTVAAVAIAGATASASAIGTGQGTNQTSEIANKGARTHILLAQSGESGEAGEGGAAASAKNETVGLLTGLGLIEGHLRAGIALYRAGHGKMAATHMKHPKDEIYTSLLPMLEKRGIAGFSDELEALALTVEGGKPVADAEAAFGKLVTRIGDARSAAGASAPESFKTILQLVRTAGDEYEIGVKDGEIVELHEYQDAWGFVQCADGMAKQLQGSGDAAIRQAAEAALVQLASLSSAFQSLNPQGKLSGDEALFYAAAAHIELASLKLK